jgi:DNA ligase-1
MLFAEVVATSKAVAATRKRTEKIAALADLLARTATEHPDELEAVAACVAGEPRQGRVGVGWATVGAAGGWPGPAEPTTPSPPTTPKLTVAEVDDAIGRLPGLTGAGSAAGRQAMLAGLFARATADERDFLVRLLLGELRQGALESLVADAVARAAGLPPAAVRRALMLTGDLPATARVALTAGEAGLAAVHLEVLRPILPMLAGTASDVAHALASGGLASVEWKLDGARIQAHRAGSVVRLYTRNLNDVTERLPTVAALVASLPAASVILDGEALGVGDGERPDRFQDTMSRFGRHAGAADLGVWWFDCLHLDGEDLIDQPLRRRQEALQRVAGPWRVPSVLTDDPAVAAAFLANALAAGHEGVVVKAADSPYEAGRRGQAWRKVKPVRTFDLVVLAAEWGHGRRAGWLSNLHLGALGAAGAFVMVGKTFKGLTDELLAWQTDALLARETSRTGQVVWVRPELVVEVALDGVQRSSRYPGGVALRFARVRRYRPDKRPDEADPIDALQRLLDTEADRREGEGQEGPTPADQRAAQGIGVVAGDDG